MLADPPPSIWGIFFHQPSQNLVTFYYQYQSSIFIYIQCIVIRWNNPSVLHNFISFINLSFQNLLIPTHTQYYYWLHWSYPFEYIKFISTRDILEWGFSLSSSLPWLFTGSSKENQPDLQNQYNQTHTETRHRWLTRNGKGRKMKREMIEKAMLILTLDLD